MRGNSIGQTLDIITSSRQSRPSVSKVIISAAVSRGPAPGRSRGWRGPAFDQSYSCTRVPQSWLFFLLSLIQRSDKDWRLLAFLSSSITSTDWNCSQTKKKGHATALPASVAGSSYLSSSKVKKQRSFYDQRHWAGRSPLSKPKEHPDAKLELKKRAIFPVPHILQDFDRRSNPNRHFNHAQVNLTTHEHWRRLHEKFFAPDVLVEQSSISFSKYEALRKIKEIFSLCLWPQSFISFVLSFFSRFTVALKLKTDLATRQENWKSPDVQKLALVPPLVQVGIAKLLLFVTLPTFFLERSFLHQNKAWRLGFSKHPPKRKFPHRNDL